MVHNQRSKSLKFLKCLVRNTCFENVGSFLIIEINLLSTPEISQFERDDLFLTLVAEDRLDLIDATNYKYYSTPSYTMCKTFVVDQHPLKEKITTEK